MATTTFIAGAKVNDIKSFVSDAVISVAEKHSAKLTSHPVDRRNNVSDHIFKNNLVITVKGSVSNYPTWEYPNNEIGYTGNRVEQAHTFLKNILQSGQTVSIVTEHSDVYNNCFLIDYDVEFDVKSSEVLNYTCVFEQVRFANSQRVLVTEVSDAVGDNKAGTKDVGSTTTKSYEVSRALPIIEATNEQVPATVAKLQEAGKEILGIEDYN